MSSPDAPAPATAPVRLPVWVRALIVAVPVAIAVAAVVDDGAPPAAAVAGFVISAAICVPIALAWHRVETGADGLRLRYRPLYDRRLAYAEIVSWSITDEPASTWRYGGTGLRVGAGGTLALVNRPGRMLEIEASGRRRYVVSIPAEDDAAMLRRTLRDHVPAAETAARR